MTATELYEQAMCEYDSGNVQSSVAKLLDAAQMGNVNAMEMLAVLYGYGDGVDYDFNRSVYWDKKAIEYGSYSSLSNLAITYRTVGNVREAKNWFEKAVAIGDGDAGLELAKLYMVSDKETQVVVEILKKSISSDYVSQDAVEQAKTLLLEYGQKLSSLK